MPSDIQWHFIGHLQSNKVKTLLGDNALCPVVCLDFNPPLMSTREQSGVIDSKP